MRTPPENKTLKAAPTTCPTCGRTVGELSCRQARDGWYCIQWGLEYDYSRLIAPEPEPLTRAEAKTWDAYVEPIAEAEARVDAALDAYTTAEQQMWKARAAAESSDTPTRYDINYQPIPQTGPVSGDAVENDRAARETWQDAGTALGRERVKLNELYRKRDYDLKIAKQANRAQGPSNSLLRRLLG